MNRDLRQKLINRFDENKLIFDEPLSEHTTFKLGGDADVLFEPSSKLEIKDMIDFCTENKLDYFVLGRGSNILVGDKGFRGVVIHIANNFSEYEIEGNVVKAQAGILLSKLASVIFKASLQGFEFASGIPGTLGGAIFMNAGAYGGEIKDVLLSASVLTEEGEIVELSNEELKLAYRKSLISEKGGVILEGTFKFEKGDPEKIKEKTVDLNSRRKAKQPLELPSAGSTFKRPVGYYAGKLIMDSGLAGYRVGGVSVSKKHCGFVVNDKNGTSADVLALIDDIKAKVYQDSGVRLECEVKMIGEF